jgi:hypothetical protein
MRAEADFNVADFENPDSKREKDFVRFFMHPVKNEEKSIEAGRPVYDEREYVEILVPGNDTNRPVLRVTDIERRRYAPQYRAWKASGESSADTGTFLSDVPWLTRAQVEELAYFKIRTLEHLAAVSDAGCQRAPGMLELRRRAQAALESAEKAAPFIKLQAELDNTKAELKLRDDTIEALTKRLDALERKAK